MSNDTLTVLTITRKTDTTVEGTWELRGDQDGAVFSQGTFSGPITKPDTAEAAIDSDAPPFRCCPE